MTKKIPYDGQKSKFRKKQKKCFLLFQVVQALNTKKLVPMSKTAGKKIGSYVKNCDKQTDTQRFQRLRELLYYVHSFNHFSFIRLMSRFKNWCSMMTDVKTGFNRKSIILDNHLVLTVLSLHLLTPTVIPLHHTQYQNEESIASLYISSISDNLLLPC